MRGRKRRGKRVETKSDCKRLQRNKIIGNLGTYVRYRKRGIKEETMKQMEKEKPKQK